jgi:hypothetical protein
VVTYFVVQAYQRGKKGMLIADQPKNARDLSHCEMMAERLSRTSASVVAFSRTGDPESGEWDDAVILARFGEVPSELYELAS